MSLQAALSTALSSLAAEQRQSALIANNIANANTEGYVRRDLPRSESLVGGTGAGVSTGTVKRAADTALAAASRTASANESYAGTLQGLLEAYTAKIGQASDERSISHRLGAFQTAMTTLSAEPSNAVAQSQTLSSAQDLVDSLHDMASAVSTARSDADLSVARDVDAVNSALDSLAEIDRQMAHASARGASTAEFEDKRDALIAKIGTVVPLRVFDNGPGQLILMSDGGNTLYDSTTVHHLSFTHTPEIPAGSRSTGSEVKVNGQVLRTSESGSIAAALTLRDQTLPNFSDMLDQVAGRLVDAFQEADSTLAGTLGGTPPKSFGLFINKAISADGWDPGDPGVPRVGSSVSGLASSIGVNPLADPGQGGQLWRLRAGFGSSATETGNASDNRLILASLNAMDKIRNYASGTGLPSKMSLSQAASQSVGLMQSERAVWTDRATSRSALALQAREELTNKTAVNIDEELQRLMLVQQTYSASVQIIQAAAKMLEELSQIR
ncbi:flagellar hook-associated protein FlgK [Teichococcus vastitatis]|uniref:Flagellar hook-associated protein 1 n=1 Tax=Teichococcus vastitatis TaxID=2307076 RepID=A0ABS9W658_9PROT|nr:flagellar hook-associated protein FlgK [Pseudoroseomonas vastitatis]MCI0754769.1 flagellar hook-associated protein FlgK [Pseudoroseomonas vastitatis]